MRLAIMPSTATPAPTVKEKKTEASWEWARDKAQRRR